MALFYILVFVVVAILFAALLVYGTQETSYEQALEEQRNQNNFDLLLSNSGKSEIIKRETKKEKAKKSKDAAVKKSIKDKNTVQLSKVVPKEQPVAKIPLPKEVETVPSTIEITFQPDIVDQAPSTSAAKQQSHRIKDVPKKTTSKQIITESLVTQKVAEKEEIAKIVEKHEDLAPVVKTIDLQAEVKAAEQPKLIKKNKKGSPKVSKELSFEDILELVNSSYFSDDDITRLTDALLNRQADEQKNEHNWHKKNDPVEALQKQLAEKKELIDQQIKNMEAAKKKSETLLVEVQNAKKKFTKLESDNDNLRKEIDYQKHNYGSMLRDVEMKSQHKFEQRLNEIRLEERNRSICEINVLQAEVSRLGEIITNQTEGMKDKETGLEEVENLNQQLKSKNHELLEKINELNAHLDDSVQQFNVNEQALKKQISDQVEQINKLKETISLLEVKVQTNEASSSEIDSYTTQINDLKVELSNFVAKKEELDTVISELKNENSSILAEKENILTETDILKTKLSELDSEKNILLSKLDSITSENSNLNSKSDDLKTLIKTNEDKMESLLNVFEKLGISADSSSLQKNIDDLKSKLSQFDELNSKYISLNDLFEQVNNEKANFKSQLDSLKQENKEEIKKAQEYAATLLETEKILNDLQEKIIKNKSEQNKKLAEFEQILSDKSEENENIKEDIIKTRENFENLSKLNDALNGQLSDLKELVARKDSEISSYKSKEVDLVEGFEKIREENKNLNNKIVKLNNMVQIGKHSFQDECQKVQDLESIISMMNGKENSSLPTSNGNSNNLPQQM